MIGYVWPRHKFRVAVEYRQRFPGPSFLLLWLPNCCPKLDKRVDREPVTALASEK